MGIGLQVWLLDTPYKVDLDQFSLHSRSTVPVFNSYDSSHGSISMRLLNLETIRFATYKLWRLHSSPSYSHMWCERMLVKSYW